MIKMVLFGDSITAGYTKKEITAKLTCRMLEYFPKADIINAGIPGETTEDGLKRIEAHVLKYKPDIVVIFFGANDVARHKFVSLDRYQKKHRRDDSINRSRKSGASFAAVYQSVASSY